MRHRKTLVTACSLSLGLAAGTGHAEQLDTVEVTDTPRIQDHQARLAGGIDGSRPLTLPAASATLVDQIDRETIERLPVTNSFDLVDYANGVFSQFQGRKIPFFANVRGDQSLGIIVDGVYLPSHIASRILTDLPLSAIERVSVVRDSTALNLGPLTADNGGFLVIETRRHDAFGAELRAGAENFGRGFADINVGTRKGAFDGTATLAVDHRDGRDGWNQGYANHGAYLRGGWQGRATRVQATLFVDDSSREVQRSTPDSNPRIYNARWEQDPIRSIVGGLTVHHRWSDHQQTVLRYSQAYNRTDLEQRSWSDPDFFNVDKTQYRFRNLSAVHTITGTNRSLRFGLSENRHVTPTGMLYYHGWEKDEQVLGGFVQGEMRIGDWHLDAGLRRDKHYHDVGYEQVGRQRSRIEDESDPALDALSLGARRDIGETRTVTARLLYSEQNQDDFETSSGESLDQEQRLNYELGYQARVSSLFVPRATIYWHNLKNARFVADVRPEYDNSGNLIESHNVYAASDRSLYGTELQVRGASGRLSYTVNYSYARSDDDDADERTPHHRASAHGTYAFGQWSATVGGRYLDEFLSGNKAGMGEAGGFTVVDASLDYRIPRGDREHHVTVYGRNLGDREYESMYTFANEGAVYGIQYRLAL